MCGILGISISETCKIESKKLKELISSLFHYSEYRGMEASGMAIKSYQDKTIEIFRKNEIGTKFTKDKTFKNTVSKLISGNKPISLIGHTRIATNGASAENNQPIVKGNAIGVHNGIICNIDPLWKHYPELNREQEIDTELLIGLLGSRIDKSEGKNILEALNSVYKEIEGVANVGLLFKTFNAMVLSSNCGSLYYFYNNGLFVFASEHYILSKALKYIYTTGVLPSEIKQLTATNYLILDEVTGTITHTQSSEYGSLELTKNAFEFQLIDRTKIGAKSNTINTKSMDYYKSLMHYDLEAMKIIKRCTRCILPESHPNIDFDPDGVCNYCRSYDLRKKRVPAGREALDEQIKVLRKEKGTNCIVMLSGGRDSCYALHVVKKELGLNPIAFSYDWGMLTDLGRRNQSRMCAKLGVEHIVVSADINEKRNYIKKNVEAFLHKPHLGMIGLFMAGDKAYHHYAKELGDRLQLPLIGGGCPIERTYFKEGFSTIKPSFMKRTWKDRFEILNFFFVQALKNPLYINASILDNIKAFKYYYLEVLKTTNLFNFLPWNENVVNKTLIEEYNWEVATDTSTTWRIGDGTAAFYNYIYATVAGFTENDCFRSNQILEGVITREEALKKAYDENKPRHEALKWYCDTIHIDLEKAIKVINAIPKLY
jgi:hypothetical protein